MEILFLIMCATTLAYTLARCRRRPSSNFGSVDAIVPAFNEGPCLEHSLRNLLANPYLASVICVNDGSTDQTAEILDTLAPRWNGRLIVVHQGNTGKGGALMHGLEHVTAAQVFLTDADTLVPPHNAGLGYMLAEIEDGADAVGGIPSSDLRRAGVLPHIRATVKMPMITIKRTFQQLMGGAPFIISGACGMFRTELLRTHGFSDRTKVEDLDLTWTLVANGYKVRQANRCVVYPQECDTLGEEWKRWRRWIVGYAVCVRLHWRLLPSRFGIFSMLPMVLLVVFGIATYAVVWPAAIKYHGGLHGLVPALFPLLWIAAVTALGGMSALHHRNLWLIPLASLAVGYVLLSYAIWLIHGLAGLITGREPVRDKPTRYARVVE